MQASQNGYAIDYVNTQGAQAGFPGSFLNQNSQAGYSRFGTGNEFMSQVCPFIWSFMYTLYWGIFSSSFGGVWCLASFIDLH